MATYQTIFQLQTAPSDQAAALFPNLSLLGVVAITIAIGVSRLQKVRWVMVPAMLLGVFCIAQGATQMAASNNVNNLASYHRGQYRVAEGPITDFDTQPDGKDEHFTVEGHYFQYSCYDELGRFHMPRSCGGPIHAGMCVRITYVNDEDIVKIEERQRIASAH